ncbi:hypothetical protein [Bacillus paramycoides]|nr:hypothetical protein [Bacillus paramycoides]
MQSMNLGYLMFMLVKQIQLKVLQNYVKNVLQQQLKTFGTNMI